MRFAELKTKEIIRLTDGKKLGFAEDLIIDEKLNISINKRPENVRKILEEVLIEQLPFMTGYPIVDRYSRWLPRV